jgi:hypothetical protein
MRDKKFNSAQYILAAKAQIHIIYLQITVVNNEQINIKKQKKQQNIGEILCGLKSLLYVHKQADIETFF